jgi:hypothetical protein
LALFTRRDAPRTAVNPPPICSRRKCVTVTSSPRYAYLGSSPPIPPPVMPHQAISMNTTTTSFPLLTTNVYVDISDLDLRVAMTLLPVTALGVERNSVLSCISSHAPLRSLLSGKERFVTPCIPSALCCLLVTCSFYPSP